MAVQQELWGPETTKAVENFQVSGERVPVPVVRWVARVKAEAARVNAELGLLDADLAERIARAGRRGGSRRARRPVPDRRLPDRLRHLHEHERQRGDRRTLAGEGVHANDHVNMGQSSNDVFPSAVHLAAVAEVRDGCSPRSTTWPPRSPRKADEFADVVKAGRTHMMDAVPVTLGQEFGGYAAQMTLGRDRVSDALARAEEIPLGGTATGTGLNTHPEFAERVRERLGLGDGPARPLRGAGQPRRARRAARGAQGRGRVAHQDRQRPRADGLRAAHRPGELQLPELQKGSSIMPGKVNPVIPEVVLQVAAQVIGNDTAVTVAGTQGAFELNVRVPVMARNVFESIRILTAACRCSPRSAWTGIEANEEQLRRHAESTPAIATALNPHIGYDKGTEIVKEAVASERTIREVAIEKGVDEATLDEALDLRAWRAARQGLARLARSAVRPRCSRRPLERGRTEAHAGRARQQVRDGSTGVSKRRTSKCRCGPVECPVEPT